MMSTQQSAVEIIKTLREHGHTALLAGGCVRDMLLGRSAKDYDVATSAHPDDVVKLFKRTLKIGAQFGVVVVLTRGGQIEVATFRTETGYVDGRHPSAVAFADAREDASRRDFTINGMFYDPIEDKVIDYVDGQNDLKSRRIRTIGDARTRFGEDFLRMLRAIRFSSQLGFEIESATWQAIQEISPNIVNISGERIAMELESMFTHPNRARGGQMLVDSKLAKYVFPNVSDAQYQAGIAVLGKLRKNVSFALALAALFAEVSTSEAIKQLEIIKLSRSQTKYVEFLLANRGALLDAQMPIATFKRLLAQPYFRDLFELQRALQKAFGESISQLVAIKNRARTLAGQELTPKPILNGHELIELGAVPGPQVGQVAEEMYVEQLGGRFSSPDDARLWVKAWVKKHAR